MIRCAVCDDDPAAAREIAGLLACYGRERGLPGCAAVCFPDGRALLESGGAFDIVFLDIRMDGPDGMETAKRLRRQGGAGLIVFVTALAECVFDAFEAQAFDYLVKPPDRARLWRTMDRALEVLRRRDRRLVVRHGACCAVIPLDEIVYCEVQGRKICIHRSGKSVVEFGGRLENLEQQLDARFFRCHRSYLVNLAHVRGCGGGRAALSEGGEIPVSRLRERDLVQALLGYMKEGGA